MKHVPCPESCTEYYHCLMAVINAFQSLEQIRPTGNAPWNTAARNQYDNTMLSMGLLGAELYNSMVAAAGVTMLGDGSIFKPEPPPHFFQ